ncbi:MAG: hypothetical protein M3552_15100 [Planctomycetota bacterium]|nr:hypothetical protein [Planctomycetaceae bacterium]MDQ3331957.1 hypothetical protein [Planctomycetota bacterium]
MELERLHDIATTVAPELRDTLRLECRGDDWANPTDCIAFATRLTSMVVFIETPSVGLMLHEVGHLLPAIACPETVQKMASIWTGEKATAAMVRSGCSDLAAEWSGHDAAFHRRLLHLVHRTRRHGVDVALADVGAGGLHYAAPPLWVLDELLGDEPLRLSLLSFASIESIRAPHEFTNVFDDCRQFHEKLRSVPREDRR